MFFFQMCGSNFDLFMRRGDDISHRFLKSVIHSSNIDLDHWKIFLRTILSVLSYNNAHKTHMYEKYRSLLKQIAAATVWLGLTDMRTSVVLISHSSTAII